MAGIDPEEAAVDWFFRLQDSDDEQLWLDHLAWMEADPVHAEAYAKVERLWIAAETLPVEAGPASAGTAEIVSLDTHRATKQRRAAARWWAPAVVAVAASVAAVIGLPQLVHLGDPAAQTYRTDGVSTKVVTLADGSRLTLNRNTELAVTLGEKVRTAELRSGEASSMCITSRRARSRSPRRAAKCACWARNSTCLARTVRSASPCGAGWLRFRRRRRAAQ